MKIIPSSLALEEMEGYNELRGVMGVTSSS